MAISQLMVAMTIQQDPMVANKATITMEIEIRSVSFDMCKHLRNASAFVFSDEEPQTLQP
jgi:ACT domain-containing protein